MTDKSGAVRTSLDAPRSILEIVLDRPSRRNALTPEMLAALRVALVGVSAEGSRGASPRAVLLRGEGEFFCAGFDMTLCRESPDGSVLRELLTGLSGVILAMRQLDVPVIIVVQGGAIAGGCALLGGADVVVAEPDAKLGYPVARLGISPAVSGPFLATSVGDGPARRLLLEGRVIAAAEAARVGLVELAPPGGALSLAWSRAEQLAQHPAHAVLETRRWLDHLNAGRTGRDAASQALGVSLSLTGGPEERELLPSAWAAKSTTKSTGKDAGTGT
ncbi:MAG: enoyl-CoA hydratase/isomerase family protein [Planctomycetota bacterium]|nr:enoyl-CoA hydratase/isomerase family protein [Planctomycetota bacterium]